MRLLHTADWHVGVTLRGRKRDEEQRAVLEEIVRVADERDVDLVVVAGDLFHNAAPTPEAEEIAYRALLHLAKEERQIILISGNHDSSHRLDAIRPLLSLANVTACGRLRPPDEGGVLEMTARSGETVVAALLPFLSQRGIVTADRLMDKSAAENVQAYADRMRRIVELFSKRFRDDAVNLVVAHLTVAAAKMGGGEREAHTVFGYHVPPNIFPTSAHYVALGHLHREQVVNGPGQIRYSGSPLLIDFGEEANQPSVTIVEARPGTPAEVDVVPLQSARGMQVVSGTRAQLVALADTVADDYLKIEVEEKPSPGLADEIRGLFPNAVDVRIAGDAPAKQAEALDLSKLAAPRDLFIEYLKDSEIEDEDLLALFDTLVEEVLEADQA